MEMFGGIVRLTHHHPVGIIKARMIGMLNANLGIASEGTTGFATQMREQKSEGVGCNRSMPVVAAGYGMNRTTEILVPRLAHFLARKVIFNGNRARLLDGDRRRVLFG